MYPQSLFKGKIQEKQQQHFTFLRIWGGFCDLVKYCIGLLLNLIR